MLLLGVLFVEPEFNPVPLGVEAAALAGALGLLAPEVPAPLSEPIPVPVLPGGVALPEVLEGVVVPPTELDVPVELAPSLPVPLPIVDAPGAPVPAPGDAGAGADELLLPAGTLSSFLRLQPVMAVAAITTIGMASHWRDVQGDRVGARLRAGRGKDSRFMGVPWVGQ